MASEYLAYGISYQCGKAVSGQQMAVAPNILWNNAIPDADSEIDFTVNGDRFAFEGVGYHDHVCFLDPIYLEIPLISIRTGVYNHSKTSSLLRSGDMAVWVITQSYGLMSLLQMVEITAPSM